MHTIARNGITGIIRAHISIIAILRRSTGTIRAGSSRVAHRIAVRAGRGIVGVYATRNRITGIIRTGIIVVAT